MLIKFQERNWIIVKNEMTLNKVVSIFSSENLKKQEIVLCILDRPEQEKMAKVF